MSRLSHRYAAMTRIHLLVHQNPDRTHLGQIYDGEDLIGEVTGKTERDTTHRAEELLSEADMLEAQCSDSPR